MVQRSQSRFNKQKRKIEVNIMPNHDEDDFGFDFDADDFEDPEADFDKDAELGESDLENQEEDVSPSPVEGEEETGSYKAKMLTAFEQLNIDIQHDKTKLDLYKIKDQLGISEDDAVWAIFVALQQHLKLYDEIPGKISDSAKKTVAITDRYIADIFGACCQAMGDEAALEKQKLRKAVDKAIVKQIASLTADAKKIIDQNTVASPWTKIWQISLSVGLLAIGFLGGIQACLLWPEFLK